MKTENTEMVKKNTVKRLGIWAVAVAAVLMIPLLGNAPWTVGDFVFATVVLFGSATVYELVTRNMESKNHRIAVGLAVATAVILIWGWAVA